jgi:uncharacterized membrane protein
MSLASPSLHYRRYMAQILFAFGVFWVLRVCKAYVTAPAWCWHLARISLSVAFVLVAMGKDDWYYAFAVAGVSALIEVVDDLLMIKGDETLSRVRRR